MSQWDGKTRGNLLGYQIFVVTIKLIGLPFAYFLLRFVSYYFYIFVREKRNIIVSFYRDHLNFSEKKAKQMTRKNFFVFGQTIIDRFAFLMGKSKRFTYAFNKEEYLMEIKNTGKGGVLLSGHVGNWEIAGNLLKSRVTGTINVLMLSQEIEKIKAYLDKTTGGPQFNIIPIKDDLSHVIKIHKALKRNEFIAIHADRFMPGSKFIELEFLGSKAKFPLGPFTIASKFKVPVTFVFAVKESKWHYLLSSIPPIHEHLSPEEIAKKFVEELEKKVTLHPEQWFNYFNFFK